MQDNLCLGIIGGAGHLGGAIAQGVLRNGAVLPENLWLSSRTLAASHGLAADPKVHRTTSNQTLIEHCDIVIVAVPPHLANSLAINASETGCLIISVMAGVTVTQLQQLSATERVVRAMSSPAAETGLAYSPWFSSEAITDTDRLKIRRVFEAIGQTDEVFDESHIDQFTALIGPVPGFVAYYADCMVNYAIDQGIDSNVAERAIRQLFKASGVMLADLDLSPRAHVDAMIDYDGTTAAGLKCMQASRLSASIDQGLTAAVEATRKMSESLGDSTS
ncbi:pyrroline-5-carboxylate reductase dimerization domain-containing protein [Amphritea sp. 1_MG-2023]|uniref:pyrroline-5-carboxylate reductase family protein n=1 Tax=Amphritea sp. 1_MG-2023 TaxID=3062670 RepID=UPI0026E49010|nr:pyrroline-5-carboxylate reductase dimerization domain-containing protein [Amphritea sp. 1_MG-2023]MDO6562092.1 pyrroline-5-carboxylate reductase dimerization domain-containing protein [Amphritea sp. 1_MG-2023]